MSIKKHSILEQIAQVKENPMAAAFGFAYAGALPYASHTIAHTYAQRNPLFWILVAGGLLTSAPKVYRWMLKMFGTRIEAIGFIVLVELAMITTDGKLSFGLLGLLILINGIEGAHKFICERPASKSTTQTTEQAQPVQAKRKRTQAKRKAAQPKPQTEQQETAPALTLATVPAFELVPVPVN